MNVLLGLGTLPVVECAPRANANDGSKLMVRRVDL